MKLNLRIRRFHLTKNEIIEAIALGADIPKNKAETFLMAMLEIIQRELEADNAVQLAGFGSFILKDRAARLGRNPQTGESMNIDASRTIKFVPGKAFKDQVNSH